MVGSLPTLSLALPPTQTHMQHSPPPSHRPPPCQWGFFNRFFKTIGFHKMVFNEVEEPELLDDLKWVVTLG